MNTLSEPSALPASILYTMIRVSDLDRSIAFYRDALSMRELRRETFTDGRFTLVFMGYENDQNAPTIELTWNWDQQEYSHGSGYGHVALGVADIYGACARLNGMGIEIARDAGPMTHAVDETGSRENIAFLEDPDGYKIELIEMHAR
ncbi:MAG: lactoylglutathione lyase [Halioglobus sp.]